ncbi:Asp-tRNA(Asn)/Glu-tRNA(Gln) amidotransferase subunit GatA [Candidatus Dojkabacteria bacterium]|nr:Asp-tRNA(Asn)/Glu-tRNA(Gln) amidotransferase subunit GatA [Candidatus Dojkabacteria bacterium]
MAKPLYELTIKEAARLLKEGKITSVELTKSCLNRISEVDKHGPQINAFITVVADLALKQAQSSDKRRAEGKALSELDGIPYSIKDVFVTKDVETTAGSKILEGFVPPYSATVVEKLDSAGAVLLGKTNCDPFGFGSSTENSAFGVTKNPANPKYVAGGSSGGSGAAVAYGGGLFSIGEDTGGSIRCPASFCGVVGLKPTYGRVSRYGAIAYASSFDCVGPITKTVEDNKLVLGIIEGVDSKDLTTHSGAVVNNQQPRASRNVIGIPQEFFTKDLDPQVKEVIETAIEKYKKLGCKIIDISLPNVKYAVAAYYVIALSEASSNLARMDGLRFGLEPEKYTDWSDLMEQARGEGFSEEEKRRVMIGTFALSEGYADQYYKKANKARRLLEIDFMKVFSNDAIERIDVVLTPTMPVLPFKIGENIDDPLKEWLADAFTASINPTGLPAISIPAGFSKEGLPIGMQLISEKFREDVLYNFAEAFENG